MARRPAAKHRLIAVDGTRGPDLEEATKDLWRHVRGHKVMGGICRWDASGIFYELRLGKRRHLTLSPRTLILLYATDLAFRVRWEVRPALAQGHIVIASPYIDTAVSFGVASGLPEAWLRQVLGFAPKPDVCYCTKEHAKSAAWKGKLLDGFGEFCGGVLETAVSPVDPAVLRQKMVAYLDARERAGACQRLSRRAIASALA
jgi:hypothetical protein